jgi:hypothetical protein
MFGNLHQFRGSRIMRRRHVTKTRLAFEELEARLTPSTNVLTYHNDFASTGLNPNETELTPINVQVGSFGKRFATTVDGQVYAQPLVATGVTINDGPHTTAGQSGVHNVVFVATENDTLYAIDADGGQVLWQRSFLDTTDSTNNTLGATAITPVSPNDVNSTDITPSIGITGTPVIDLTTNTLYVVAKTSETIGGNTHFVQRIHAIAIADGTDRVAPYLLGDTTNGNTNNTQIYVYGTGDGSVTDPYNGTGQLVVQFNALRENERGALSLVNGNLYIEWASHGDQAPYHGWVAVWDVSNLTTSGWKLTGVLNTSPNTGYAGIWQGSGRPAFEADGSAFYVEVGNGSGGSDNPPFDANGFPVDGSYYESLLKVVADSTTTATNQNRNGWGLKVADFFMPYNQVALDNSDTDFGSAAPMLLPDSAGLPGHPHLLVASGKEGKIYLIDRDNLGKFDPNNDHVLNAVPDGSGHTTPPVQLGGGLSTAAFFNGSIYWASGYSDTARAYSINADGTLSITSQTSATFGYLPGSVDISANGASSGIAWVMDRNNNEIHAYDANSLATELWNSGQQAGGADSLGTVVKFAVPTVANGAVYVGTSANLVGYGLTPVTVPDAPTLSVSTVASTSLNLTWTDTTAAQNTATGYLIEQSSDGTNFTQVTTAPAGATSQTIGGLTASTQYYFRIRGLNSLGNSAYSNIVTATTTAGASNILSDLRRTWGFHRADTYHVNAYGFGEKWFLDRLGHWFALTQDGSLYQWPGTAGQLGNRIAIVDPVVFSTPDRLFLAPVQLPQADLDQLAQLRQDHGFHSTSTYYFNSYGFAEKWFPDRNGAWFALRPTGDLFLWNGLAGQLGNRIATIDPLAYDDPAHLFLTPTALSQLIQLQQDHGFNPAGSYYTNTYGFGEEWFQDRNGAWFALTSSGNLYQWNGAMGQLGSQITTVDPLAYSDPSLLFAAQVPLADALLDQLTELEAAHNFHPASSYFRNFYGMGEKWFQDGSGAWFALAPDGSLHQWQGIAGQLGPTLAVLSPLVFDAPELLFRT